MSTILPTVVRQLDGWALFGASTGATIVTFTIAMAFSGNWADRSGPRPVLLWGWPPSSWPRSSAASPPP